MPQTTRCTNCLMRTSKKAIDPTPVASLFPEEEFTRLLGNAHVQKRQQQALREAIAPYLCLDELRHLAAKGEDLQAALRPADLDDIPQEVQALLRLLRVLLAPQSRQQIRSAQDIAAVLMIEMGRLEHEEFWHICLDSKHHIQRIQPLYKGSLNSSTLRVAEIFRLPLLLKSAAIIVAHNHPSGDPTPSPEDIQTTTSLVEAGKLLDIELLDHLIIGQGRWLSMREQQLGW